MKKINLGNPPSFFYNPMWSPDSKKIAYTDKRLNLWYLDVEKGTPVKVTTELFEDPSSAMNPAWSPDSKWLTYTKFLENHLHAVFVYSVESGKESQITDGTADSRFPVFDKNGKSLYFASSTDVGLTNAWLDLSSFQHPLTRSIYAVVLKKGDPNPVEPQSDEEKVAAKSEEKGKDADKSKEKEADKEKGKGKDEKKEGREEGRAAGSNDRSGRNWAADRGAADSCRRTMWGWSRENGNSVPDGNCGCSAVRGPASGDGEQV